jgi:hypothetical protein
MPTTTTPARPATPSTLAAQAADTADQEAEPRKLHPLVAVGAGLVTGLLLARWMRR